MPVITAGQLRRRSTVRTRHAAHAARFAFAGIVAELRSTQPALIDELRAKYRSHLVDERPAFTYAVCESESGYTFSCAHDGAWEWTGGSLPSAALAFLADAALMSAVVHADASLRSVHAAAVAHRGAGALIAGSSTAGKTTTLLACARSGMQVFSDERALVRNGTLHAFLRRCSVRSGGRALLLQDDHRDKLASELLAGATEIDLAACFGVDVRAQARIKAAIVLGGRANAAKIEEIDAQAALPIISRWFDARGDRIVRIAHALALLRGVSCYHLTLGSPAQSAHAIRSVLERCP